MKEEKKQATTQNPMTDGKCRCLRMKASRLEKRELCPLVGGSQGWLRWLGFVVLVIRTTIRRWFSHEREIFGFGFNFGLCCLCDVKSV